MFVHGIDTVLHTPPDCGGVSGWQSRQTTDESPVLVSVKTNDEPEATGFPTKARFPFGFEHPETPQRPMAQIPITWVIDVLLTFDK
jgi:hypothetical protein